LHLQFERRLIMTMLETIIEHKKVELAAEKQEFSVEDLMRSEHFKRDCLSLRASLTKEDSTGIIAEFKRKSPSKGFIKEGADISEITSGYAMAGAAGMSVLTDNHFFGGSKADLLAARAANPNIPLLRKDFMIDSYQLYQAKAWGADVILLIAACLSSEEIKTLSGKARELGLEVLLEVHNEEEILKSPLEQIDVIGVNNRNLKNFSESNINASLDLARKIPAGLVKISESCISEASTISTLKKSGYQGFLIGETFMKMESPGLALKSFIEEIKRVA
jgi:indole-3-glycerol phosphate synthase